MEGQRRENHLLSTCGVVIPRVGVTDSPIHCGEGSAVASLGEKGTAPPDRCMSCREMERGGLLYGAPYGDGIYYTKTHTVFVKRCWSPSSPPLTHPTTVS